MSYTSYTQRITLALALLLLAPGAARAGKRMNNSRSYKESYRLEAKRDYSGALRALEGIRGQRSSYFLQLRVGWLRYLAGKQRGSIRAYRAAVALRPRAVEPYLGLMLPQMASRRWKDALKTGRQAVRRAPGNVVASTRMAWILFNLGRHAESVRVYRHLLEQYPSNLELRRGLGWALLKQGKAGQARQVFDGVLQYSPSDTSALAGLRKTARRRSSL